MDILKDILGAIVTLGVLGLILIAIPVLFMVIFDIARSMDKYLNR